MSNNVRPVSNKVNWHKVTDECYDGQGSGLAEYPGMPEDGDSLSHGSATPSKADVGVSIEEVSRLLSVGRNSLCPSHRRANTD